MNILLWIFQIILAVHTAIGAVWKFSHSPGQTMPSLSSISGTTWQVMGALELVCALVFVLPVLNKSLGRLVPVAATFIACEMLIFCAVHTQAVGTNDFGPMIYWLVTAGFAVIIALGRFASPTKK